MSKFYATKLTPTKIYIAFLFMATTLLSACGKDEVVTPVSILSVVNMSPTLSTYDVYLADQKFNSAALPFGGAISYTQVTPASYSLKFMVAGRSESVLTKTVGLTENVYYSYFLIDRGTNLDGLLVGDDLSQTSTDKAFVRFINLSPDAPALELSLKDGTSALITAKAYKAASSYITISPGSLSFSLKDAAGNIRASITDEPVVAGYHYTIVARGLVSPTTNEHPLTGQLLNQQ